MRPERLDSARRAMEAEKLDALLVAGRDNVRWLSGFSGSSGAVLLTLADIYLFTDGRYAIQAMEESLGAIVRISPDPPVKQAAAVLAEIAPGEVGFESDVITVSQHTVLQSAYPDRLRGVEGLINRLRAIKDSDEIALLRTAAKITDEAFARITGRIRPDSTEQAVARELAFILSECGAECESFPSIVASGERSALPHARPTTAPLRPGHMLLMDFGAQHGGYAGDITRTVFLGPATERFRDVYRIVAEAQLAGIACIRPGVSGRDVDAAARRVISDAGYGPNFGHGLGHQLGLNVHDGPGLSPSSAIVLEEGMVVTVEPGIYLEGWGGVRIEDDLLVTATGCELLTRSPKALTELFT